MSGICFFFNSTKGCLRPPGTCRFVHAAVNAPPPQRAFSPAQTVTANPVLALMDVPKAPGSASSGTNIPPSLSVSTQRSPQQTDAATAHTRSSSQSSSRSRSSRSSSSSPSRSRSLPPAPKKGTCNKVTAADEQKVLKKVVKSVSKASTTFLGAKLLVYNFPHGWDMFDKMLALMKESGREWGRFYLTRTEGVKEITMGFSSKEGAKKARSALKGKGYHVFLSDEAPEWV